MRCATLAERLGQDGARIVFICRELPGNMCAYLEGKGFEVLRLPAPDARAGAGAGAASAGYRSPYAEWLGVSQARDASETLNALEQLRIKPDWVIVDNYALDGEWEKGIRRCADRLMVIDDLADRTHDCDILLDQNLYDNSDERYESLLPATCIRLLGPRYALLRPEFLQFREKIRERDGAVGRLLVGFGGSDPTNETEKVLEAILELRRDDIAVDVILGQLNPYRERIASRFGKQGNFVLHVQPRNIGELMARADLAIGAAGVSTWERCCLGLPSIVISVAENQAESAATLGSRGCVFYVGPSGSVTTRSLWHVLSALLERREYLAHLARVSMALVDGKGASRIAGFLDAGAIVLRRANDSDCENVYQWRNSPETVMQSFGNSRIPHEEHSRWFADTLARSDRVLLIGERDGRPVGVLRYDLGAESANVSIYLVPGLQGRGYGREMLRAGSKWLVLHHPEIRKVRAEIRPTNAESRRVFHAAGYRHLASVYEMILKP